MLCDTNGSGRKHDQITLGPVAGEHNETRVGEPTATSIDRPCTQGDYAALQRVSPELHELPSDIQTLIFTALPFRTFVCLFSVCKAWCASGPTERLIGGKIREMGCAASGRDIMAALQRTYVEAAMPPDWEAALLLAFASRVEHVELHDHTHLTQAWMMRLLALKDIESENYRSGVVDEIDSLHWFAQPPRLRYTQCDERMPALFSAAGPRSIRLLPSTCMPRIVGSIAPYHSRPMQPDSLLYRLLNNAADALWGAACGGQLPGSDLHIPYSLLHKYVWEWLVRDDLTLSVSDVLRDKFNISIACQQRELDGFIAERLACFAIKAHLPLRRACDRWRVGDADFLALVEQHGLRRMFRKALRDYDVDNSHHHLRDDADLAKHVRKAVWCFETNSGDLFGDDPALALDFERCCRAVALADDLYGLRRLQDECAQMPWRVVAALMQRLASRRHVLKQVTKWAGGDTDDEVTLREFAAWRDSVAPLCLAGGEFDLAARVYAAPITASCQPRRIRGAHSDKFRWTINPQKLMHAAFVGLTNLSPKYWHEIFESLARLPLPFSCRAQQADWMRQFLLSPVARARYPSAAFGHRLILHASRIWTSLPDEAQDGKMRLDVFCERFDLVGTQRAQLRIAIIDDICARVLGKVCTLDDALHGAGFQDDIDTIRLVEHKIWHSALRLATLSPDSARAQFVSQTRGSAFLRNQAAIFFAGTIDEVALEPL